MKMGYSPRREIQMLCFHCNDADIKLFMPETNRVFLVNEEKIIWEKAFHFQPIKMFISAPKHLVLLLLTRV